MPEPSKAVLITGCSIGHRPRDRRAPRRPRAGPSTRPRAGPSRSPTSQARAARRSRSTSPTRQSMRAAVDAGRGGRGRGRRADQQRRLQPERRDRDACRWRRCGAQFETNVFGLVRHVPARAARDARASAGAGSSTSARWAASCRSRAAAPTTRPSTRSRRSQRRAALRGQGLRRRRRDRRAGPDHDRVRRDRGERALDAGAADDGPYGDVQRARSAQPTAGAYDGARWRMLGGGPGGVAKAIEKAIAKRPPDGPLHGHAVGASW